MNEQYFINLLSEKTEKLKWSIIYFGKSYSTWLDTGNNTTIQILLNRIDVGSSWHVILQVDGIVIDSSLNQAPTHPLYLLFHKIEGIMEKGKSDHRSKIIIIAGALLEKF